MYIVKKYVYINRTSYRALEANEENQQINMQQRG